MTQWKALSISLGVQDAERRRKGRTLKGKDAESDDGNDVVDLTADDSDSAPLTKRQRQERGRVW